jgi:hypothetical protein
MYISKARRDTFDEKIGLINGLLAKIVMEIENNPDDSDEFRILLAGGCSDWISKTELEKRTDNILLALRAGAISL